MPAARSGPEEHHGKEAQDVGGHQLLPQRHVQHLGQLAAVLALQRQQQEGHGDDARQQEEQEGAAGQLLGGGCEREV